MKARRIRYATAKIKGIILLYRQPNKGPFQLMYFNL